MAFERPRFRSDPRTEAISKGLEQKFLRIRRELHFWSRNTKVMLILVILLCLGGMAFGEYGAVRIVEVKKEKHKLEADITTWKMKQCLLEEQKQKLADDPFTLEKLARERCGYYKPGELIFVFPESDTAATSGIERASLDKLPLAQ